MDTRGQQTLVFLQQGAGRAQESGGAAVHFLIESGRLPDGTGLLPEPVRVPEFAQVEDLLHGAGEFWVHRVRGRAVHQAGLDLRDPDGVQ